MNKAAIWIDFLVTRLLIFMAAFVWVRYYVRSLLACLALTLAITVAAGLIWSAATGKRRSSTLSASKRKKHLQQVLEQFIYNDADYALDFFYNALSSRHKCDRTNKGCIIVDESVALFTRFGLSPVSAAELNGMILAARALGHNKIAVFAAAYHAQAAKIFVYHPSAQTELYDGDDVYALLERLDCFPPIRVVPRDSRVSLKSILPVICAPDKARHYTTAALVMFCGCLFLPFKYYYAFMTSLLLIMALLSRRDAFARRGVKPRNYFS